MSENASFDLRDFMPYLLNQAAEETSRAFSETYRKKYGMLQTEWRVLFHLGRYGDMTAKDICNRARIHKTKVSRAVHALEQKRFLSRKTRLDDRRHEELSLTKQGQRVFADLNKSAQAFDAKLTAEFEPDELARIRAALIKIAKLDQAQ
ncbi:MAG: MarR family winged helix-turn-helix transcriptional regulator [Pseudomonadota bacterium]